MILQETLSLIKNKYPILFQSAIIEKVTFGLHFTAVKLSTGFCGMAKTETQSYFNKTYNRKKDFSSFSAGKIIGQYVSDLFSCQTNSVLIDVLKLAVLNALSAEIMQKGDYKIIEDKDPIELIELKDTDSICIVGAFQSYISKISKCSSKLFVVELDENALDEEQKKYFVPAHQSKLAFSQSDIIIITGSTLVNNTLDELLKNISHDKQLIVVGPTGSIIPDIFFKHHVNIIGAIKIIDDEKMFHIIEEGGAGYHLFQYSCAKKICLLNAKN